MVVHQAAAAGGQSEDGFDLSACGVGKRRRDGLVVSGCCVCCDSLQREVGRGERKGAFEDRRQNTNGAGNAAAALERKEICGVRAETLAGIEQLVLQNIRQRGTNALG